jgi:putative ATP-dependent endonuclease of OLD family
VIKPFLPHDWNTISPEGFNLWQNSLGFNNLIYIATVLGDIKERVKDDLIPHFALLIEEPEAHIHPQLQLSLFNFLKEANSIANSQLFITTHSPTLTSRVPFENLILLDRAAYTISDSFDDREAEKIIQDTIKNIALTKEQIDTKKNQLQRYIDVTKSQLFFSRGCLFVEGISEELLISAFSRIERFALEDYRIELVNVDGISFYPFLFLFSSTTPKKRLPKRVAILTDDDRYPASKEKDYSLEKLVENDYAKLLALHNTLTKATIRNRIKNLNSVKNGQAGISVHSAFQTMEYDLCRNNVHDKKDKCQENFLFKYISVQCPDEIEMVNSFMGTLPETLDQNQQEQLAILLWKCLPGKAIFAQHLSLHILAHLEEAQKSFVVPAYIRDAFIHLKQ